MLPKNNQAIIHYNAVAKFLHWITALLIITNYLLGLYWENLNTNSIFIRIHIQIGLTILILVILRIIWRVKSNYPNMLESLSSLEKILAKAGHCFLYLLMLAVPVLGVSLVQAYGYPLILWNVIKLPQIIQHQPTAIANIIVNCHIYLAHTIIIIAVCHALFALKHQFINKDGLLFRILPMRKQP